jgi:hypothetical protein
MPTTIALEQPDTAAAMALIAELEAQLDPLYPPVSLYERAGFQRIGPFGPYWDDPLSLFFEKRLTMKIISNMS